MRYRRSALHLRIRPRVVAALAAIAVIGGCSGDSSSGPKLNSVAVPDQIEAVDVGDVNGQEPFGDTQLAGEAPNLSYEFEADLTLPKNDTGYVYRSGGSVDPAMVQRLANYFGVGADQVQNWDDSAAALPAQAGADPEVPIAGLGYSPSQALQQWSYANYELSNPYRTCEPSAAVASQSAPEGTDPSAPGDTTDRCVTPEPSGTPPTAEEAEAKLSGMLSEIGVEHGELVFQTYADEYNASTNAVELDGAGLKTGREWSATYGPDGVVISAMGPFAVPERVGPYQLVDIETAKQRVVSGVNSFGGMGAGTASEMALDPSVGTAASEPTGSAGGATDVVRLVAVSPDLFWIWDATDTAWLVPAYAFGDADGGVWSVPAVPDDLFADPG